MMKCLLSHILPPQRLCIALLFFSLLGAFTACSDDDHLGTGKATVKMTFTTRASAQADGSTTLAERERMKTLRVIMENAKTGKILYNVFYDNLESVISKTITFQDVPVEAEGTPFNFYAIANEVSFLKPGELLDGKELKLNELYSREIAIDFNSQENKKLYIPQAKKNQKTIQPLPGIQTHTVQLEFPVAKVHVHFSNEIEAVQQVQHIMLPGLKVSKGMLFPQDFANNEIPSTEQVLEADVNAGNITFAPNPLSVPAGTFQGAPGTNSVTPMYLYPVKHLNSNYQLTANWPNATNLQSVNLNASGQLSEGIRRGMQLNIGITLKYGVMELKNLTVSVDDWQNGTVTTPEFQ